MSYYNPFFLPEYDFQIVLDTTTVPDGYVREGSVLVNDSTYINPTLDNGGTTGTNQEPTSEPSPARTALLDQAIEYGVLNPLKGGAMFDRATLDVPMISNDDLVFIVALFKNPASYLGGLDASNTFLFQVEVVSSLLVGVEPQTAIANAIRDIKGNIYLYDGDGNPITNTAPPKADSKTIPWLWIIAAGLLILSR